MESLLSLFLLGPIAGLVCMFVAFIGTMLYLHEYRHKQLGEPWTDASERLASVCIGSGGTLLALLVLPWVGGALVTVSAALTVVGLMVALYTTQSDELRTRVKAASGAAMQALFHPTSTADEQVVAQEPQSASSTLGALQEQLDVLKREASLTEGERAERTQLVGTLADNASRLTSASEDLHVETGKRDQLAGDVAAVLKHELPEEVVNGLNAAVTGRNQTVGQKQETVTGLARDTESARQALETHLQQPRPERLSPEEALERSAEAIAEAQKALGNPQ